MIPSRADQFRFLQMVLERFQQRRVGDTWYMISAKWWAQWQAYIESPELDQPDMIDNLVLLVPGTSLGLHKRGLWGRAAVV